MFKHCRFGRFDLLSKQCWIDKGFIELFRSASMEQFDDFTYERIEKKGKLIRAEQEKNIIYFEVTPVPGKLGFYIKTEFPKLQNLVWRLIHFRIDQLASRHELNLLRFYKKNNIQVVNPVAWGEKRVFGIPVSGFLVQEEVKGDEFTELVKTVSNYERIKLIKAYGKLLGEIHSKGIFSSAVRVTDLICTSTVNEKWEDINLVIIDRESGELVNEKFTYSKCQYSLSFLLKRFIFYIDQPSTKEKCYFLKTYLDYLTVESKPEFKKLYRAIMVN